MIQSILDWFSPKRICKREGCNPEERKYRVRLKTDSSLSVAEDCVCTFDYTNVGPRKQ